MTDLGNHYQQLPDGAVLPHARPTMRVADPHPLADQTIPAAAPRRRIRGLQLRALPSAPMLAQLVGGGAAMYGVWLAFGTAVALIVGGVAAAALGALREAGKV